MTVLDIQRRLKALGFDPGPLDGVAGRRTVAAIKGFQAANGLVADGLVGPKTRAALQPAAEGLARQGGGEPGESGKQRTSTKGLIALMNREACVLSTYLDSQGVATIGVGHTAAAGGLAPSPGVTLTLEEALELFRRDIARYEEDVRLAVRAPLAQHEFDALVSFHFNTGGIGRAELTKRLNAGDKAGAGMAFLGWLKPPEIEGRRRAEMRQFQTGDYGDLSTAPVYERFPGPMRRISTAGLLGPKTPPDAR